MVIAGLARFKFSNVFDGIQLPSLTAPDGQLAPRPAAPAPVANVIPAIAAPQSRGTFAPAAGRASAPFATTSTHRAAQARQLLIANNAWPPAEGQVFVIQIDQDSPKASAKRGVPSKECETFLHSYSGQTCVFVAYRTVNGHMGLRELTTKPLTSASHPAQTYLTGYAGVAWVRSGVYTYDAHGGYHSAHMGYVFHSADSNAKLAAARDLNHDGAIDATESAKASTATAILFHAGSTGGPRSAGCQTMPPADNAAFFKAVTAQQTDTFTYLLVRRPNDKTGANPF